MHTSAAVAGSASQRHTSSAHPFSQRRAAQCRFTCRPSSGGCRAVPGPPTSSRGLLSGDDSAVGSHKLSVGINTAAVDVVAVVVAWLGRAGQRAPAAARWRLVVNQSRASTPTNTGARWSVRVIRHEPTAESFYQRHDEHTNHPRYK